MIVLSNEGRKQAMFKKYGWYIFGIVYLLVLLFCIVSDNQSLKNLIVYIITAITAVTMIYINKKY
jgi:uncharacterized membrane protein